MAGLSKAIKVIHTIASLDNGASGPSYTVPMLVRALAVQGHEAEIITLGKGSEEFDRNVRVIRCPPNQSHLKSFARLGLSSAMRELLLASSAEVFHTHGVWMMPNVYPGEAARRAGRPFVLAPRGMLGTDALKFSRTAKRVFWALWQKQAVDAVSCFHATAHSEYEDIRAFGLRHPVAVIPNGIDLPGLEDLATSENRQPSAAPYILSLGRIHPKKALDRLIAAFALVAHEFPLWRLRLVGPDEGGYAVRLARQVATSGLDGRVTIEAPLFGADKTKLVREAELFALSTLHENFGMTVAESLVVETPVISTKGAPWAGLAAQQCGWWIDHGPEAMAAALREAMSLSPDERAAMGARGRAWMARDFGWDGIAAQMIDVYRWLLNGGVPPSTVRMD